MCLRSEPVLPMIRTVHAASFTGSSKLLAKSKAVCSMHSWPYAEQAKVVIFFSTKKICVIRVVKHCIFNFTSPKIEFLPPKNFSQKQKKTNLRSSFHFLFPSGHFDKLTSASLLRHAQHDAVHRSTALDTFRRSAALLSEYST